MPDLMRSGADELTETPVYDPGDSSHFRTVLGKLPTAVAVIASVVENAPVGVSVGSFVSVSLAPPLVGFFISEHSTSWPRIESTGGFCASILSERAEGVSRAFAQSGADKFRGHKWTSSPSGRPILEASVAWMDCSIEQVVHAGDHHLVLGQVGSLGATDEIGPLLFLGGAYGRFEESGAETGSWA